ncbi:ANTAR domain-containing protein [Streptomyces sp. NPDC046939]|uniref:ANTAR domain-containing protein n=1 Tax=Streptomyces sp. NPDC046939 TaxID=3155376 RepID=UPI0033F2D206
MTTRATRPAADRQPADGPTQAAALRAEIDRLKEAVGARADVDRAVGVLMAAARIPPASAFTVLRATAQRTDTELGHLAVLLTQWGRTRSLPTKIRTELRDQLRQQQDVIGTRNGAYVE